MGLRPTGSSTGTEHEPRGRENEQMDMQLRFHGSVGALAQTMAPESANRRRDPRHTM